MRKLPGVSGPEMAKRLGIGVSTLYRWMKMGLPSDLHRFGMKEYRRFHPDAVYDWLESQRNEGMEQEI